MYPGHQGLGSAGLAHHSHGMKLKWTDMTHDGHHEDLTSMQAVSIKFRGVEAAAYEDHYPLSEICNELGLARESGLSIVGLALGSFPGSSLCGHGRGWDGQAGVIAAAL